MTRAIAAGLDVMLMSAMTFALYLAFVVVDRFLTPWFNIPVPSIQVFVAIGIASLWLYAAWSWSAAGRTLGDHLMGLRVLDRHGGYPGLALSALRAACCLALPLGLLWVLVSRANRSLQDVLVGTTVVYDWVNDLPTTMP
ncbi:MAG: RDD family protein [Actinomycetales bacterium]|nr:RDD family protein [Actinomycetales bacterium]